MNKKLSKLLILGIVSFSMVLFSCKKDETENNNFSCDGDKFNLSYCGLDYKGELTHSYEFDMIIATTGISYNETSSEYAGTGSFIKLKLYSADVELLPGTYTVDAFASRDSLTIDFGSVEFNHNFSTAVSDSTKIFKNGVIDVSKRGNTYNLDFEFYTYNDTQIKGFYVGQIDIHNTSKK